MEADWEVEVGGGAAVIDALWPGFIDLRRHPERLPEIAEAAAFPPLAALLQTLNGPGSPVWTAKCDLWEPEPAAEINSSADKGSGEEQPALACYIDLLPCDGQVFAHWEHAEALCRQWVARLTAPAPAENRAERGPECEIDFVVRQSIAGPAQGFGVTAYIGAGKGSARSAAEALAAGLVALAGAILQAGTPAPAASKLQ